MDSQTLFQKANEVFPGGVNSPVRNFSSVGLKHPLFIKKAYGSYVEDAQGQRYLDFVGSWGPMIHGHSDPDIVQAVREVALKGLSFGAPTELETHLAYLIQERFPVMEKIRLTSSGTEATMTAVRIARGVTNRPYIIKFKGCYHGHHDTLLVDAGSGCATGDQLSSHGVLQSTAKYTLSLPFNDTQALIDCFKKYQGQIAGAIIEPIAGNMGLIAGEPEFLEKLRELTRQDGSLCIFDEVMTGFRIARGGATEVTQIEPDLITLGKIVGGGLPLAVVGGRADIMDNLAPVGKIYHAGTLSGNPCAVTAGIVTLEKCTVQFYEQMMKKTQLFIQTLREELKDPENFQTPWFSGMIGIFASKKPVKNFSDVQALCQKKFAQFFQYLLKEGIYWPPSLFEAAFLSGSHKDQDLKKAAKVLALALKETAGQTQISD